MDTTQYVIAFDLHYPDIKSYTFIGYVGFNVDDPDYLITDCNIYNCKKFNSVAEAENFYEENELWLLEKDWYNPSNPRICSIEIKHIKSLN